jgi:hypothetical protein
MKLYAQFWQDATVTYFWNRVALPLSAQHHLTLYENARLLALLNLAQADGIIATFDAKYTCRVKWHRSFGTVAFCLPPIMIVLGVIAAIDALHRGVMIGPLDPSVSAGFPLIGIVAFAIVIYASWGARRRPDAHKRLILIATMGLVAAAFGRFPWARVGLPPDAGAVTGLGILILILLIYELITIRRIHRSTMWAAPLIFASVALAVPIGMTPAWHAFAALLNRTIGPHI